MSEFDAIVVGSGITGGWAAKELCERGLKVLLLERGPAIDPAVDYSDMLAHREQQAVSARLRLSGRRLSARRAAGSPIPLIDADWGENERRMMREANQDAVAMLQAAGCIEIQRSGFQASDDEFTRPGGLIHEMGTARMGRDPATSVLNGWNQAHDVPNLFITDGACMTSSATQNPSLTYMALTARAADYAAELLREGKL